MSNYPPGVSGNEWQIAGYPSMELKRDCEEPVLENSRPCPFCGMELWDGNHSCEEGREIEREEKPCTWKGVVDVELIDDELHWICPDCEAEHTEEFDDSPDPDREYDSRGDRDDY